MEAYLAAADAIASSRRRWLVTGGAGFIGSHLVERLLSLGQRVTVFDNFSTGTRRNIRAAVEAAGGSSTHLSVIEGDVRHKDSLDAAFREQDVVLHQAALGSVPRSIKNPIHTHESNATGTLNVLDASRRTGVARFVLASSSSVYGDDARNPRREDYTGRPLSPYAASKASAEGYLSAFALSMGLSGVVLRYFNVFGPRQDPDGGYAAVIPRWIREALNGETRYVFGDGNTTRDFCYIENVVQANLLAAHADEAVVSQGPFNIACGQSTSLLRLSDLITESVFGAVGRRPPPPRHDQPRTGDVQHSCAVIDRATRLLGYEPVVHVAEGLVRTTRWLANAEEA